MRIGFIGMMLISISAIAESTANVDWSAYLGGLDSSQYSALDQINRDTVDRLEVAWTYHSENQDEDNFGGIQCNPLVIDGVLYGVSPAMRVFALNAASGEELWSFSPPKRRKAIARGFAWWEDGDMKRLLYAGAEYLYALNPATGKPDEAFGENGRVDLRKGLGRDPKKVFAASSSPGVVFKDVYIIGIRTNESLPAAPGFIRAYNIRTGDIVWTFRTIPQPGEFGYGTWPPEAYTYTGGANSWPGMSLDAERGIVYVPTGAAASDFYGADRHGDNLFANCLIALDADTGERKWHFQTVHHDLWDRDLPAPPNLLTVEHKGKRIDAVAQITKSAHIFLFNRETGEPLFDIKEVDVPASDLEGELASPTQPLPVKPEPFSRQRFRSKDITNITPESKAEITRRWKIARKGKQFVPPSVEGTIVLPGFDGGGEWGGAAVDPDGILYVNGSEMPWILQMVDVAAMGNNKRLRTGAMIYARQCLSCHGVNREGNAFSMYPPLKGIEQRLPRPMAEQVMKDGRAFMPSFAHLGEKNVEAVLDYIYQVDTVLQETSESKEKDASPHTPDYRPTGYIRFVDSLGYPAIKPPWGTLNAIDMNSGKLLWKSVLGDTPELREKGHPQTGTENYGGPVVTAGGLIFIAATKDAMFHAYDKDTGKLVWETKLPQAGFATPSTYMVDGVQYVVIAASGGKIGTPAGDAYVAFRLKN